MESSFAEIRNVSIDYIALNIRNKDIGTGKSTEYLIHLYQSGIFANSARWRYTDLLNSRKYLLERDISHNNGYELNICIEVKNKEDKEKVVKILGESGE